MTCVSIESDVCTAGRAVPHVYVEAALARTESLMCGQLLIMSKPDSNTLPTAWTGVMKAGKPHWHEFHICHVLVVTLLPMLTEAIC